MTSRRQTKYCQAVHEALSYLDIATNNEILQYVRRDYPEVSATTIHRVTARLLRLGEISLAPPSSNGAVRYDVRVGENAYFSCSKCSRIRRLDGQVLALLLEKQLEGCSASGQLTVTGICKLCKEKK
ncbi:hypothetical protein GX865_02010 [Candidatus Saccharibacteria bacterium]|jgi:Fe2+ or Zn2+ uptake regulation protein|nr:hypothetical protein [Candidatus Saccharibacteria bacterium]